MDAALVVTRTTQGIIDMNYNIISIIPWTTTSATRSYLLLASPLMREDPDTAEFKSPVGEDEAATAKSGILLYIIWRGNSNILTVCFEFVDYSIILWLI